MMLQIYSNEPYLSHMSQFTHILVTSDLSQAAGSAFRLAGELAKRYDAQLTILSIFEDPVYAASLAASEIPVLPDPSLSKEVRAKIEKQLREIREKDFSDLKNVNILVKESIISIPQEIVKTQEEIKADLIIIASHGRSGIGRLLLGSVAENVARLSKVPVMIVPVSEALS